jgi:hypothetical protein
MANVKHYRIAVLWRGDRKARRSATPQNNRYHRVFEELAALGIHAEPAVYADDIADEVREQLLAVDGVLVWVDPISEGTTRAVLDAMLRDVAARGPWVSAHPVILKMGVKEVLYCEPAWNKDPVFGVIGIQSGPRDGGFTVASVGDAGARLGMLHPCLASRAGLSHRSPAGVKSRSSVAVAQHMVCFAQAPTKWVAHAFGMT